MSLRALACPACGAPLPSNARRAVVVCPFCKATVSDDGPVVFAASFRKALAELGADGGDALRRVRIAGLPYRVHGRIAQGHSSDVYLAERAHPVTERVVIKVLRADQDADLLDREWEALAALHASEAQGAEEMARRLPHPVARGPVEGAGNRRALVLRAASGFVDTFEDVLAAYPMGVDGRHAAWMWRRILETLGFVHRAGLAHGAILPAHLLVHARDHGVMLVGWSCAARLGGKAPLPVVDEAARELYPEELLRGEPPSAATDIAMSARTIARLLGGAPGRLPPSVPAPMRKIVEALAAGGPRGLDDAWEARSKVGAAAHEAYGPPRFHPFAMPGWD
jgi:hypothetical protein